MDFSLKKSLMSHGSYEHMKNIAGVASDHDGDDPEELPILSDQDSCDHHRHRSHRQPMSPVDSADRREVIVKINNGDSSTRRRSMDQSKVWRGSIYEFWREEEKERDNANDKNNRKDDFRFMQREQKTTAEDPPSKLIGQFLHKQRASGNMSLDLDLEMNELRRDRSLPSLAKSSMTSGTSKELKVLFQPTALDVAESGSNESVRRRYKDLPDEDARQSSQQSQDRRESTNYRRQNGSTGSDDEVLRCTSNAVFDREVSCQKKSTLLRMKTKSRLIDPPEDPDHRSGRVQKSGQVQKSGHVRSGILGKGLEDDEDDPFWEEDLPDEYRRNNLSALILIQWFSLILILGVFACTLSIPFLRHKNLWKLKLWKWEVLILVLICGRLVSGWGVRIVVFFIERNFLLRKRVLYFVYGVKNSVQNCLWLGLVLMAWHFLFDKKVQRETKSDNLKYVTKVLICFLVGTLVWLAKTLMVKVLASSFHVSKYFDRIQESLFNQYVIEVLSGAPLIEIKRTEEDEERLADDVRKLQNAGATIPPDLRAAAFQTARIGRVLGSGKLQRSPRKGNKFSQALGGKKADERGITLDHLHKLNPKNVSAWNMKRLMNIVRHGSLSTIDEQILESTHDHEKAIEIRSEVEAKAAAKKIFQNVARPGAKHIYLHDLMRFMGDDEALKTMSLFEGASESRKISKASLKNWVVNAFRERRALSLTLNDTKFAVNKLHRMVNIIIGIVIVVIWLLILEIATRKFLLFVSSQLVLVAFIFGNTCKTVFESIVFLFVMHPFDVGDRCVIDGVEMVVEEMNILTTVFLRYDNTKLMYPNSVLSTKPINNYYRSPDMGDAVDFCIHMATPAEKIAAIRQRILNYVDNKKEHWYPSPMILMTDMEGLHTIKLAVWLTHRMNYQDLGERWVRRGLLVEEMTKIFLELDIQYRLNPLDINIRTMPPVTSSSRLPSNWTGTTS